MKNWVLSMMASCCLTVSWNTQAQNNQEIKVKAEQIAYLKIYGELIWKGYEIARAGLNLIGDIKNKDFLQHRDYFKSLATVSGAVRKSPKATRIEGLGWQVMIVYYRDWDRIKASDQFSRNEKDYLYGVYQRLIQNCQRDLDAFEDVITDAKLVMKDGERLARLDKILSQLEDHYHFICRFSAEVLLLEEARKKSQKQATLLNQL